MQMMSSLGELVHGFLYPCVVHVVVSNLKEIPFTMLYMGNFRVQIITVAGFPCFIELEFGMQVEILCIGLR